MRLCQSTVACLTHFQVMEFMDLATLYHLSRTRVWFRNSLSGKSNPKYSERIWAAAHGRAYGLPRRPSDLTWFRFVELVCSPVDLCLVRLADRDLVLRCVLTNISLHTALPATRHEDVECLRPEAQSLRRLPEIGVRHFYGTRPRSLVLNMVFLFQTRNHACRDSMARVQEAIYAMVGCDVAR